MMWARLADWAVPTDALHLRRSLADRLLAIQYDGARACAQIGVMMRGPVQRATQIVTDMLRVGDA